MIILINAGKALDKIQHLFMEKTLSKPRIEGNFLTLIKNTYQKKYTAHIILNGETVKDFQQIPK